MADKPQKNQDQRDIHARFYLHYAGANQAALDVDLVLPGRGITAIVGHSGSGKTSLLRCLAGLEGAAQGELHVAGQVWQQGRQKREVHQRAVGLVFQESSLFAHLNVEQNLNYAIKRCKQPTSEAFYQHISEIMAIGGVLQRHPSALSGGERQRVAIARALLSQPGLLLMDEPLASLDQGRKQEIMPYLETLHTELEIPVIYVSHSIEEVCRLADHLVVLEQGQVIAQGPLNQVVSRASWPGAWDRGASVVLDGHIIEKNSDWQLMKVACAGSELWLADSGGQAGQSIRVQVLASDVILTLELDNHSSILNRIQVQISEITQSETSAMCQVYLHQRELELVAQISRYSVSRLKLEVGQTVWAQIKSAALLG